MYIYNNECSFLSNDGGSLQGVKLGSMIYIHAGLGAIDKVSTSVRFKLSCKFGYSKWGTEASTQESKGKCDTIEVVIVDFHTQMS